MKGLRFTYAFMCGAIAGTPVYVTINDNFFSIARVEGCSMQPTLNPTRNGNSKNNTVTDYVFLNKWILRKNDAKTGDIVVVTSPKNFNTNFIKRVIGVEGDLVRTPRYKFNHMRIPRGHCWLEGDNIRESLDSNSLGPISANMISAVATHIVWPPSRWQRLECSVPVEREPVSYHVGRESRRGRTYSSPVDDLMAGIDCVNEIED